MKKILVVDDSEVLRKITSFNLKKAGYEVFEAFDGIDGLEKIKSIKPDLIILDIMMPRLDGFGVLKEKQKIEEIKDIPVIILTAKGGAEDEKIAKSLGANLVMTKPFSPSILLEEVKRLMSDD
ncbi:chemotaxis protein CheY [Thermosipho melanesiensis]|uniref:Response regulator receiver protein n=2 Tax=Thermosipho melanesiensis TaxID=46541 RepID=A6LLA3_THEM4|nr:response regulator [Thermosipho melanesiensis]ABR30704.1 response regulator receiver protein [Thermosipho melanesiensis BI429]APT73834.1 chemotaxis protein CheY [Thermosipho melanesiensis]OOC35773.1 chemotaxis protein CheY [Thermosipho melanesiensis]OOC39072.1 chemotaxis protein CheY [Thermosipho melanesiensis]OOC39220.1 chemotaxis protein CheY [Thermosipho melanesiensis]